MSTKRQEVRVFGIQDRRTQATAKRPWLVRWSIDGRERAKAFRTKAEADRYRAELLLAVQRGEPFDAATGQPEMWVPSADPIQVHVWARRWLAEQWPEWQPRTRASAIEAVARFVPLMVLRNASEAPAGLRRHLARTLRPDSDVPEDDPCERWLARWSVLLTDLDRVLLAEVDRRLGVGDSGQPLAAWTTSRHRKLARSCIRRAVDLDLLAKDPWPPAPKGRSRRKSVKTKKQVDIRQLPDPSTMAQAIAAIPSHQPSSRTYQVMTAVMYYAGLRPSEVVMLRPRALRLPSDGWGRIDVLEADISFDESGEPKTGERSVPIPPVLVAMLREWVVEHAFADDQLIFRTRTGSRPGHSNWARTWQRALRTIGHPSLRVYDCRHAAATTWLRAGVPLGEVARRMGHSVETLVSTYVGALAGDEEIANERIEAVLARPAASGPRLTLVRASGP